MFARIFQALAVLRAIRRHLANLRRQGDLTMATLADLQAAVAANTASVAAAVAVVASLKQQVADLAANQNDPAAMQALVDELAAAKASLDGAVA